MVPHVCEHTETTIHMYTSRCVNMGAFPKLSERNKRNILKLDKIGLGYVAMEEGEEGRIILKNPFAVNYSIK